MSTGDVSTGLISFVDSYRPALPDGDFEVIVAQRVTDTKPPAGKAAAVNDTYVNRQLLRVEGPQYALRPDAITALFPPPESNGEYDGVLPHVVLSRKSLAWERTPFPSGRSDGTPWLALLVFADSDAPSDVPAPWEPRSAPVSELYAPPPGVVSYPVPRLPAVGEEEERCQLIDVPVDLWQRIAPTAAELALLAHGRELTGENTAENCVVVANRLPRPNERNVAHLVSVEGIAPLLPGGLELPTTGAVRVVSLRSWSFTSVDPDQNFTGYLQTLSEVGPLTLTPQPIPTGGDEIAVLLYRAVTMGYAPKNHRTHSGDQTVSFYRGPLLPYVPGSLGPLPAATAPGRIDSSDALLRYDSETGMLDVTYAAAWQLGRSLLLADTGVAAALTAWKNDNLLGAATALERAALAERLGGYLDLSADGASTSGEGVLAAGLEALAQLDLQPIATPTSSSTAADRAGWFRGDHADAFAALVRDPVTWSTPDLLQPVPVEVTEWLGRLHLLTGVPAAYLVPDASMLEPETLRLFTIDADWQRALFDGAFSVGRTSQLQADHDSVAGATVVGSFTPASGELAEGTTLSGFLLNSAVVAGWPQLEVRAFDAASRLPMVRMERLAPSLLLFIAAGTIATFEIAEAPEGLHFGVKVDPSDPTGQTFVKTLRAATPGGADPGTSVTVPFRTGGAPGVLDIDPLAGQISAAAYTPAPTAGAPAPTPPRLTAGQFAWQMVEGTQSVAFSIGGAVEPEPSSSSPALSGS